MVALHLAGSCEPHYTYAASVAWLNTPHLDRDLPGKNVEVCAIRTLIIIARFLGEAREKAIESITSGLLREYNRGGVPPSHVVFTITDIDDYMEKLNSGNITYEDQPTTTIVTADILPRAGSGH